MVAVPPLLILFDRAFFYPTWSETFAKRGRFYEWIFATYFILVALMIYGPRAESVGFHHERMPWYEYLITQCWCLWRYMWLSLIPVGSELCVDYGRRPEGSHSKLSTFKDGAKILWTFVMLMKETRPFTFFGLISLAFLAASSIFMTPVLIEYFTTGLVPRMPTWVFSLALLLVSIMMFTAGLILDSVSRARTEQLRLHYIATPARAAPAESLNAGIAPSPFDGQETGPQSTPRIVRERHR